MGNALKPCPGWRGRRERREIVIVLVGLEGAGKTATAEVLEGRTPGSEAPAPTVGFQCRRLRHRGRSVRLHDVGGGGQFRAAWKHYFPDAHGLVFVVDAADPARLTEVAQLLDNVLSHPYISGKPILILANKQDLEGAMDDLDIVEKLNIETVVNKYKCPTRVEAYSTSIPKTTSKKPQIDQGLKNGYEWLLNYIIHKYDDINSRVKSDLNKELLIREKENIETLPTGFENPNYNIEIRNTETQSGDDNIIIVQHDLPNNKNVKLSPLFGKRNAPESDAKSIELEPRTHMRKLSPVVRKKVFLSKENLRKTSVDEPPKVNANEIFASQLREFKSRENLRELDDEPRVLSSVSRSRVTEVSLGDSNITPENFSVVLKTESNKKILPPIKLESIDSNIRMVTPKQNESKPLTMLQSPNRSSEDRPKSASESVRKQLENVIIPNHKNKLGKLGFRPNRTSPEDNTSLFMFDPEKSQDSKFESADEPDTHSEVVVHPSL